MRELKFRAWRNIDGRLQRYVFSPFAYEYPDPDEPVFHAEHGVNDIRDFMPLADIIEQYTGLKDRNGKEIYEWDIVQRGPNHVAIIKWSEANARFIAMDVESRRLMSFDDWTATHELVIIGNARENPELLGEERK